jgi:hypothetical protein
MDVFIFMWVFLPAQDKQQSKQGKMDFFGIVDLLNLMFLQHTDKFNQPSF